MVLAGQSVASIAQLIGAFDSRSTALVSEAEEEVAPTLPPALGAEAPGKRRAADASRRVNFAGARPLTSPDSRGMPSDPTGTLAGAGLGRRQTSRLASLYASELDEEGDVPLQTAAAQPAPGEDDLLSKLLQQGGRIDPQALASLEMLRMIREMRADDQRRRAEETDDSDLLGQGKSATSLGYAMAGMTMYGARIRDQPRRIVDEYRVDSNLELNIRAGRHPAIAPHGPLRPSHLQLRQSPCYQLS